MTYGDYIRQMNDDQLTCLLFMVQKDGADLEYYAADSSFECESVYDWNTLVKSERPDAPPKYGIM